MLKELVKTGLKKENSRDTSAEFDKILYQSSSANKLSSKERERKERISMMDISEEAGVEARLKSEKKKALLDKIEKKTTPKSKEDQKTLKQHKSPIDMSKKASITFGSKKSDANKKRVSGDPKRSQNLDLKIKKKPSSEPDRTTKVFDTLYKDDTKVKISKTTDVPISRNSAASKSALNPFEDIIRQKELQMKLNKYKSSVESKTGSSSQNDRKHTLQKSDKVVKKDVMTVSEKVKLSKQENSKPRQDDTKSGKDSAKKTPKSSEDLDMEELKKKVRQEVEREYKAKLEKLKAQENLAKPKEISSVSKDKETKISKNGDSRQETKPYNPLDTSRPKDQKQPSKPVDEIKHKSSSEKDASSKAKAYDPLQSRPPFNVNGASKTKDSSNYPQIKKKHEDKDARPRDSDKQYRETERRDKDKDRERDREREKERDRERDRDRERNRDRGRDTDIDRDREKDRQRQREKDKAREREKERERRERERRERERKERERKEREKEAKNISKHRESDMEEEEEDEGEEEDSMDQEEDESESFDSDASGPRRYADYGDDLEDINKESLKSIDDNEISAEIAALEAKLKRQRNMQEKEKPRKGI